MNVFVLLLFGGQLFLFCFPSFLVNFPSKILVCLFYAEVEEEKMFSFYSNYREKWVLSH